jgi:hypothetical protein
MTEVEFGRLRDIPLRSAWANEARDFTPWLASNIDHLGDAIGIPLELTGREVAVGPYAADIEARSKIDGAVVLIENQLEDSDHGHLGQVMTYLAGLKAEVVIWVAQSFREQHLSALRWLNEHTAEGISFFAVRLRVVRIGTSPLAPIFEVVEKPNTWDRQIKKSATSEGSAYYDVKQAFWQAMLAQQPQLADLGVRPWRYSNNYISLGDGPRADISIFLARNQSGIYVRAGRGEGPEEIAALLEPHRVALEQSLGAALGPYGRGDYFLLQTYPMGHEETEAWGEIITWLTAQIDRYRGGLIPLFQPGTFGGVGVPPAERQ